MSDIETYREVHSFLSTDFIKTYCTSSDSDDLERKQKKKVWRMCILDTLERKEIMNNLLERLKQGNKYDISQYMDIHFQSLPLGMTSILHFL